MNMSAPNPFRHFWNLGFKTLLPLLPVSAELVGHLSLTPKEKLAGILGKAPGVKYANGKWGFMNGWSSYEAGEADLDRWFRDGANVGFRVPDDMVAIDIDASDQKTAEQIEAKTIAAFGPSPIRIGNAPRRMLFFRTREAFKYASIQFAGPGGTEKVEIMGPGRQVVLYGTHPKTKAPYAWPVRPIAHADLSVIDTAAYTEWFADLKHTLPEATEYKEKTHSDRERVDQRTLVGDLDLVREAVRALPNTRDIFPDRNQYIEICVAIKAALPFNPEEAFDLWCEWGGKDVNSTQDLLEKDWRGAQPPFGLGAKFLYDMAEKHSGGAFGKQFVFFDDLSQAEEAGVFAQVELNASKSQPSKFRLLDFDEAADGAISDTAQPLIKGLLDQGAMSVLYGDSNVGKTFVAMDMGYHIASGLPYAKLRTEHMFVIYVAMEGGRGAKRRLAALRDKFKPAAKPLFKLLPSAVDLRRSDVELNDFISALKAVDTGEHRIGLIVVDTLARAMAGGDENSSVDMGAVVKNVGAVQAAIDAHVMVVHHTGKDRAKGARGHTSLRAATDTELEVGEGTIAVTKQRDLDKSWTSAFSLEVRQLGLDRDGDPVTSCTVKLDVASAARKREATEGELAVLDAIETISDTSGKPEKGARTKDLETWCKDNLSGMTRDTLNQHIRGLRSKSLISQKTRGYWISERKSNSEDLLDYCEESVFD